MRNQIIATLVGAVILFFWQFLSWGLINIHGSESQYTPNQDAILEMLSQNLEEGQYFLPTYRPGATTEEMEAAMTSAAGKPWATINYHESLNTSMGMNMVRGFVIDLVIAFLLVWLLMKIPGLSLGTTVLISLAVGFIGYFSIPYLNTIWFETSSIGYLVDAVLQWGLLGVWLGWYLPRNQVAAAAAAA